MIAVAATLAAVSAARASGRGEVVEETMTSPLTELREAVVSRHPVWGQWRCCALNKPSICDSRELDLFCHFSASSSASAIFASAAVSLSS
jgi:hypothetical protein